MTAAVTSVGSGMFGGLERGARATCTFNRRPRPNAGSPPPGADVATMRKSRAPRSIPGHFFSSRHRFVRGKPPRRPRPARSRPDKQKGSSREFGEGATGSPSISLRPVWCLR